MKIKIKKATTFLYFLLAINLLVTEAQIKKPNCDREKLFNNDWKFKRDSVVGAEEPTYDDSKWIKVDLPHDWSIMNLPGEDSEDKIGPFSKKSPAHGNSTGHVLGGTAWYRKSFTLKEEDKDKTVILKFDGVYMESDVWINGKKIGVHKNGYTPFWFDISSLVNKVGVPNVIALKVENTGRNSRYYSGSGIYRNVNLMLVNPVHVGVWGVKITTPKVDANDAIVAAEITIQNEKQQEVKAKVTVNVRDADGNVVETSTNDILLTSKSVKTFSSKINIKTPALWTLESPNLYRAEIIIKTNGKVSDVYNQTFGIRSIQFSAEKGFLLNGKSVLLKGGCLHHDNGLLGAAAFDRAEERKVEIMKANGYNAIRCAHNPYSTAFYDACDRLGVFVIDEFTDMWEDYKNPQDYARFFKELWNKDITDWMMRDRNHPSIIMWSIGNEIPSYDEENRVLIGRKLANRVRELDDSRAVTQAITGFFYPSGWETTAPTFASLDVCGYNYKWQQFEKDHAKYPDRVMFISESYPKQSYDYWKAIEKYPYAIGDFVWTAMDYIGEVDLGKTNYVPADQKTDVQENFTGVKMPKGKSLWDMIAKVVPTQWPDYLSGCGDIDITGEKKPQIFWRDVIWGSSKLEINVHEPIPEGKVDYGSEWAWPREYPRWSWLGNEGKLLQVRVFTSYPQVKLELNGKTVGEKMLTEKDKYIAAFEVTYQPGELKAIALDNNGKEVASKILKTSGKPVAIRLSADRSKINADRNDLSFVKIEVVDENGQIVPYDLLKIKLSLTGDGELIASGNGSICDMESFNKQTIKTYMGRAQAIIRPFAKSGTILLNAESDGLPQAKIKISVN